MMQASSTGKMALIAQQVRMDTISNNMANVSTSGFKSRNVTFKDMLYTKMRRPTDSQEANLQRGTGVLVASTDLDFAQGIPEMTGSPLDFYIDGLGLFAVKNSTGETLYTRNGTFGVSVENDGTSYLITGQGYRVLDDKGEPIKFPEGSIPTQVQINTDGSLQMSDETESFAKLGVYNFQNPYGLESVGSTAFKESVASGAPIDKPDATVFRQGYIEASNVDMTLQMTNLIKTQRAFSFASRAITTADEMDSIANNMRN